MPVFVMPQLLLCGLFEPRGEMASLLNRLSDVMPLSYAVGALTHVTRSADFTGTLTRNLVIIFGCAPLALILGAATFTAPNSVIAWVE